MKIVFQAVTCSALLAHATGCTDPAQPEPKIVASPVTELPGFVFPALSRPGEIYYAQGSRYNWGIPVRFVLYQDSTFGLQTLIKPQNAYIAHEFAGRYSRVESLIKFRFDAYVLSIRLDTVYLEASGSLRGDSLYVAYDISKNDFAEIDLWDGVYLRSPGHR